jgi:hypothetical protein
VKRYAYIAGGVLAALVVAFVAGRYSAPVKVEERVKVETKIETVTEWKDRIVYVKEQKKKATTTTTKKPGGEIVIVKVEETDTDTRAQSDATGSSDTKTEQTATASTVTTTGRPGWALVAGGTWNPRALSLRPERYRLGVDRRLLGTVWLSLAGSAPQGFNLKEARVDAGLRMEF